MPLPRTWVSCAVLMWISAVPAMTAGREQRGPATERPKGEAARGEEVFRHGVNASPPCITCHQVTSGGFAFTVGPSMVGLAKRAAARVDGKTDREYLEESILKPKEFLVPGYKDLMYPDFSKHFSQQDLADLVAYLMTL